MFKLKKKILEDLDVIGFLDSMPAGNEFDEFVELIHGLLPEGILYETVYDSCLPHAGEQLTQRTLVALTWRLAGNVRRLRHGHPVLPWEGQDTEEWVPVQVLDVGVASSRRGKLGGNFALKVLAGQSCPEEFNHFWTTAYCHTFSRYLGFSRYHDGKYPLRDVRELVNFRFLAQIVPNTIKLSLDKIACPPSYREWNHNYLRRRLREPGVFECPRHFPRSVNCYQCYVGQDECPVAVHATTYFRHECPECGKEGWFEGLSDTVCVDCNVINAIKRKDRRQ